MVCDLSSIDVLVNRTKLFSNTDMRTRSQFVRIALERYKTSSVFRELLQALDEVLRSAAEVGIRGKIIRQGDGQNHLLQTFHEPAAFSF